MSPSKLKFTIFCFLLVFTFSCKNEHVPQPDAFIEYNCNGQLINTSNVIFNRLSNTLEVGMGEENRMSLVFFKPLEKGEFRFGETLGKDSDIMLYEMKRKDENGTIFKATDTHKMGTLNISSYHDGLISGSFSFSFNALNMSTMKDDIQIIEKGKFENVPLK